MRPEDHTARLREERNAQRREVARKKAEWDAAAPARAAEQERVKARNRELARRKGIDVANALLQLEDPGGKLYTLTRSLGNEVMRYGFLGRKRLVGPERFGEPIEIAGWELQRQDRTFGLSGFYNEGKTFEETVLLVLLVDGRLAQGPEDGTLHEIAPDGTWCNRAVQPLLTNFAATQGVGR